jgi:methyl-accepting chemotaxis protein-2 (aspartate sensor receptor)
MRVQRLSNNFAGHFSESFTLDSTRVVDIAGKLTPMLCSGATILNLNFALPDQFMERTGASATLFAKMNDDFVRVTTSVKSQDGKRAIGTTLDRSHTAYRLLLSGQSYIGYATLFGKQYMTKYDPIRDSSGKVIGVMYVGLDVSNVRTLSIAARLALTTSAWIAAVYGGAIWLIGSMSLTSGAIQLGLLGVALTLPTGVFVYFLIYRHIIKSLLSGKTAAQRMADGDLTAQINVDRRDDIGQLLLSINSISIGLTGVVGNVRQASDGLLVGLHGIAKDNLDLSQHAARQSGAVKNIVSAIHEVTTAVQQNEASTQEANRVVSSAFSLASRGGEVVEQVVSTMGSIRTSAHQIADIISMIDSIAFQTNILALNAAVEAARAGEQGRGFAVVAAEVRGLAQRSAAAAKQISALITRSVDTVDSGGKLVEQAGTTMKDVVSSIQQVVTIINDISVASRHQNKGIGDVSGAIDQMSEMSRQSMDIVTQTVTSAEQMREQADALSRAVEVFKLALPPAGARI